MSELIVFDLKFIFRCWTNSWFLSAFLNSLKIIYAVSKLFAYLLLLLSWFIEARAFHIKTTSVELISNSIVCIIRRRHWAIAKCLCHSFIIIRLLPKDIKNTLNLHWGLRLKWHIAIFVNFGNYFSILERRSINVCWRSIFCSICIFLRIHQAMSN